MVMPFPKDLGLITNVDDLGRGKSVLMFSFEMCTILECLLDCFRLDFD